MTEETPKKRTFHKNDLPQYTAPADSEDPRYFTEVFAPASAATRSPAKTSAPKRTAGRNRRLALALALGFERNHPTFGGTHPLSQGLNLQAGANLGLTRFVE